MDDSSSTPNHQDVISSINTNNIFEWTSPPEGVIKINVDATFNLGYSAAAAVARDHNKNIVAVASTIQYQSKPQVAEAAAFLLATKLAQQMQFRNCIIEGDCQTVVEVLNGEKNVPWRILRMIQEIKNISQSFRSVTYNFVKRKANSAAHNLASYAVKHSVQAIWTSSQIPPSIVSCLSEVHTSDYFFFRLFFFFCKTKEKSIAKKEN
ncbi:uncharacterized protein LOC113273191 [Papaver somniferum]|uniref:uncharacterized protein LOC113273191 n=1 Tax=Papaver somniferum TaxID=3469 RepID=UPI000E70586F|nr:uncharacterized protein LOC113273191 [Papaver somniferum]